MTTKTISKTPTKKFTYLRIPLDDNLSDDLQYIMNSNPYFSQVDAAKFAIGKYMKQEYINTANSNININRLKFNNPQTNSQDVTNFLQNNPDTKVEFDTFEELDQLK
jgi:hypothetical protein